jgi:uncharacterized protein YebE (UPF0316 family)
MSLFTMRFMLMARGYKLISGLLGFIGSIVFVIAIRPVVQDLSSWGNLIGYAAGFSTGMVIGLIIEERIAVGYTFLRIFSSRRGKELAEKLRHEGFAITEVPARGKDGYVSLLHCFARRKRLAELVELIQETDEDSFISAENVRSVRGGFWPV